MTTTGVSIRDVPNYYPDTQEVYSVNFNGEQIRTVVTKNTSTVDHWIRSIYNDDIDFVDPLIVGFDVEWRPNFGGYDNRVATLQLCVGRRCLIFQIMYADKIPTSLRSFLENESLRFVGVGIGSDAYKLGGSYNTCVLKAVDLKDLAAEKYGRKELKNLGLMKLAQVVLGCGEIEKPEHITLSNWSQYHLTREQIQYACVDAYVSFKIGKQLLDLFGPYPGSMLG
ncbi:hypothetical protein MKW94_030783 [Papaver nudicaule]|uniref:3'-5' exonuclease domain-containing protein n=1 Tax=Papaver nudicaule TaxID=74823 RepID=A0AA41RX04_PAPNU|nr:hypothetical protein [Papaver nudicaule]